MGKKDDGTKRNLGMDMNANLSKNVYGILSDIQIDRLCQTRALISHEYNKEQLSGCSYEFRVGKIAYSYDYDQRVTRQRQGDFFIINPFETLTITTLEKVAIDNNHFLLLFSKGFLFSLGLTPVSTAADPGFRGHLGITMTNLSSRPIRFESGKSFVKGVFFQLAKPASISYTGQHGTAEISWPYPSQFHMEPLNFDSWDAEHWQSLPLPLRASITRLRYIELYVKWIFMAFLVIIPTNFSIWLLKGVISQTWYNYIERVLSIVGAFTGIAGFILTLGLLLYKKR